MHQVYRFSSLAEEAYNQVYNLKTGCPLSLIENILINKIENIIKQNSGFLKPIIVSSDLYLNNKHFNLELQNLILNLNKIKQKVLNNFKKNIIIIDYPPLSERQLITLVRNLTLIYIKTQEPTFILTQDKPVFKNSLTQITQKIKHKL
jgi:argonaute-like protein implicated in RNA metabolism and viral defense